MASDTYKRIDHEPRTHQLILEVMENILKSDMFQSLVDDAVAERIQSDRSGVCLCCSEGDNGSLSHKIQNTEESPDQQQRDASQQILGGYGMMDVLKLYTGCQCDGFKKIQHEKTEESTLCDDLTGSQVTDDTVIYCDIDVSSCLGDHGGDTSSHQEHERPNRVMSKFTDSQSEELLQTSMDKDRGQQKWQWGVRRDQTRGDVIRHKSNSDNPVVLRRKDPGERHRKNVKKRWSVRPDVSMVGVPPGKQCHVIGAVVLIFFSVFLTLAGLTILVIVKPLTTVFLAIGVTVLLLGIIAFAVGLTFLICVCCFRKSTQYKQYIARYKEGGDRCDITEVPPSQTVTSPMLAAQPNTSMSMNSSGNNTRVDASQTTVQTNLESDSISPTADAINMQVSPTQETTTPTMFVTANDQTPSPSGTSPTAKSPPAWVSSGGYQPLKMTQLTDYTLEMETADDGDFDVDHQDNTRYMQADVSTTIVDSTPHHHMTYDYGGPEEDIRHTPLSINSDDQELMHLMSQRQPVDTSTPVVQNVLSVPIIRVDEKDGNVSAPTPPQSRSPPAPTPPSYDHVIKNYKTYSRSSSPVHEMETDV